MEDMESMARQLERIVHKYTRMEKGKRYIKGDISLSYAEIHTIDAIGSAENMNVTQLASFQGITKGAVSQMINKLVEKGFVKKCVSPESEAVVILKLTEGGEKIYQAHSEYHRKQGKELAETIGDVPEEYFEIMQQGMDFFEKFVDQINEEQNK